MFEKYPDPVFSVFEVHDAIRIKKRKYLIPVWFVKSILSIEFNI
jgi:hypothetical protein